MSVDSKVAPSCGNYPHPITVMDSVMLLLCNVITGALLVIDSHGIIWSSNWAKKLYSRGICVNYDLIRSINQFSKIISLFESSIILTIFRK